MDPSPDWPNVFDACDSSSSSSTKSTSQSSSSMSVTTNSTRSTRSRNLDQVSNLTSIVPSEARNGVQASNKNVAISAEDQYQEGPMLISPPAEDQQPADTTPHCTGCKSSSPAVANCFSCTALLCANCVIAHQLMVAFEGHHVTNLGQGNGGNMEVEQHQIGGSIEAIRKMVKDSKKKLNELQKTIKSVNYSSSRYAAVEKLLNL